MLFGPVLMMSVLASDGGNSKLYGTVVKFLQVKFDMRCMFDLYFALKVRKRNKKKRSTTLCRRSFFFVPFTDFQSEIKVKHATQTFDTSIP